MRSYKMADWLDLYKEMGVYLAPSMAKDHPNLPVVKEEGCYYWGADGKTWPIRRYYVRIDFKII